MIQSNEQMSRFKNEPIRVAVGISGGVDSAVAAALLKEQGYEVIGVHLYCYDEGPYCTSPEDRKAAVRVAKHLEIPILVWDLRREYKDKVIKYFFAEYKAGRTPNPDVVCNREIKFGLFMEKALHELKVDYVATGHYARIKKDEDGFHLLRGADESKDQSYFIYNFNQKQLEHILFPIGDYKKSKVRQLAQNFELPNYSRKESMGVCFIGPVPIAKFLRENLTAKVGSVINSKGEIIGEHDGVWFFTEGQRHGFRIFKPTGLPLYVIGKNVAANTLIVGRGEESKVKQFLVENPHWINIDFANRKSAKVRVRIRHLGEIMPATIEPSGAQLLVTLKEPAFGVAPGQSTVFYHRSEVLGGGVIEKVKITLS
jgi:tRNA-specific 2-thiouridylase